jgi:NhaP-type Na+/H+ or K+/H+ antiporter
MGYGGLRGAVAFYLSLNINTEYKHLVIMTTICLIIFTIVGLGSTTTCLLQYLNKAYPEDEIIKIEQEGEDLREDDDYPQNGDESNLIESLDKKFAQRFLRRSIAPGVDREIPVNFEDDDVSYRSGATEQDKEELRAFFNRNSRAGDISPGRSLGLYFGKNKNESPGILNKRFKSEVVSPGFRQSMKVRKYSQEFEKRSNDKPTETPKFAHTTKSKGALTTTFGDLVKSNSEDLKASPLQKEEDSKLPRLNLRDQLIIAEKSEEGSDEESKKEAKPQNKENKRKKDEEFNDSSFPLNESSKEVGTTGQPTVSELYLKKQKEEDEK